MTFATRMWERTKEDVSTPTEALGAALHRDQHPTRTLDGFSCPCFDKAERLMEWLRETGYDVTEKESPND
jgi:hypothetical protein